MSPCISCHKIHGDTRKTSLRADRTDLSRLPQPRWPEKVVKKYTVHSDLSNTNPAGIASSGRGTEPPKRTFHHVHLNATDPAAAIISTLTILFGTSRAFYFTKVKDAPPSDLSRRSGTLAGARRPCRRPIRNKSRSGTKFETPTPDTSDLVGSRRAVSSSPMSMAPNHALIELNTAAHHHFGHVHLP